MELFEMCFILINNNFNFYNNKYRFFKIKYKLDKMVFFCKIYVYKNMLFNK